MTIGNITVGLGADKYQNCYPSASITDLIGNDPCAKMEIFPEPNTTVGTGTSIVSVRKRMGTRPISGIFNPNNTTSRNYLNSTADPEKNKEPGRISKNIRYKSGPNTINVDLELITKDGMGPFTSSMFNLVQQGKDAELHAILKPHVGYLVLENIGKYLPHGVDMIHIRLTQNYSSGEHDTDKFDVLAVFSNRLKAFESSYSASPILSLTSEFS